MTTTIPVARLQDVADINPPLGALPAEDESVSFLPMSAVAAEVVDAVDTETREYREVSKGYTPFIADDVLVAKITPCFENGKIAQAKPTRPVGFGSTEFYVIRTHTTELDPRYLVHFLRQERIRKDGEQKMTGSAGQRRVPEHFLANLRIPVPLLPEQRRIAKILDVADVLRARRGDTLQRTDGLAQDMFLDIFGDPRTNSKHWEMLYFRDLLEIPLRNGLSPSRRGKVQSRVLTLSAITGGTFDASQVKVGTFDRQPPTDQRVEEGDFLICRGNGNIQLVGIGCFPPRSMTDIAFPDTVIAARISPERCARAFLQCLWNSRAVREQVERIARTTNGTYKVNQPMVEGVTLPIPPLAAQHEFGRRISKLESLRVAYRNSLDQLDALFTSLQHRAFRGEL